jgi:integrase
VSIRRRPVRRLQVRLMIDGRRYSATLPTREDARDWERLLRAKSVTGSLPRRVAVRDYASQWIAGYDTAPANTRRFHQVNLEHIVAGLGAMRVSEVTPSDITRLMNHLIVDRSAALAERVYRTTSALFSSAAADGLCPNGSPVRSKKHRPRRQRDHQPVLERHHARLVLSALTGWQRDTALVQLALGARFGEIAGLTRHDVDLVAGLLHIPRRYSAHSDTIRATKNHRRRTLALPRLIVPTLERRIAAVGATAELPELADRELDARPYIGAWLLQTATGRPPSLTSYNRALAAACAATGSPKVSSHGLRHTYVSWMIDEGHSADKIAFWIGDTPMTVRLVYAHMLEASSAPAAAAMDAALEGFDAPDGPA